MPPAFSNSNPSNQPFDLGREMHAAQAALGAERIDDAEAICNRILKNVPGFPPATFFLAVVASKRGDTITTIERLRVVVQSDPNAFEAIEWLANLTREQGETEESKQLSERMIRMRPTYPGGHIALGLCLIDLGLPLKAVDSLLKAISLAPGVPVFHFHLGRAFELLERFDAAIAEYRRAISLAPEASMLHEALGKALYQHADKAEGLKSLKKAAALAPTRDGLVLLATALADAGLHSEAEPYFKQAIQIDPDSQISHEQFGYTLQVLGRFDEAEASLNRAIQIAPEQAGPYLGLVGSKVLTEEDLPLISRLEEMADDLQRSHIDLRKLNYALGKAFSELGRFEDSIRRYDLANEYAYETFLKSVPFIRRNQTDWFDAQITTFTEKFFDEHKGLGSTSEVPIFIVGMVRSGTTLTDQILCSHPRIGGAGELMYWLDPPRTDLIRHLISGKILRLELQSAAKEFVDLLTNTIPGFDRVTDKMPLNYMSLGLIHLLLPNAKIIHVRRNPVDTCLSIYMTPFEGGAEFFYDRQSIVEGYQEYSRMMNHWRCVLPSDRFHEIDYERLVTDRETVTRGMIQFLGLEWNDACLQHQANTRSVRTPSWWQVRQPIYSTSVDRWRNYEPWLREFRALLPED